jgi:hypothetical protein
VSVSKINLHVVCCIYRDYCRLSRLSFRRAWRRTDLRPAQETLMSPGTPQHGIHVKVVHRDIRSILFIHFFLGEVEHFQLSGGLDTFMDSVVSIKSPEWRM